MKNNRIALLLFFTILCLTVLPMLGAFYFLDHTLETSLNLAFNPEIHKALEDSSGYLKRLKIKDPDNEVLYKAQFQSLQELRLIYSQPEIIKQNLSKSLTIYFGLGVLGAVLISVLIAVSLSRRIARSYTQTFNELSRQKDKVRYLEEMGSWQELARMLAHEIKNPLTPIEILVSSLSRSYESQSPERFKQQLEQTEQMVGEEVGHLKTIVNRFSEFSKLPKIEVHPESILALLEYNLRTLATTFKEAEFHFYQSDLDANPTVEIDASLFRQVLNNIIRNGIEANPNQKVSFSLTLKDHADAIDLLISNNGVPVPKNLVERMFDPYVSGKKGKDNMGLGLAIVKKIIIEHGGDITYTEINAQPTFSLSFRKV